ncbi:MAG: EFR1 family ferrodoxin [Promethearchaeota archaeon]
MKVLILYFSGTGNTHYVASYLYQKLSEKNLPIELLMEPIENVLPETVHDFDIVCFGFPVFALGPPDYVKDYINSIPSLENTENQEKGLFLFCTKGLAAGNANRRAFKLWQPKGYHFFGSTSVLMPGTDGLAMLKDNSSYIKRALKKDYDHLAKADKFLELLVSTINLIGNGEKISEIERKPPFIIVDTLLGWSFRLLYIIIAKFMKKKYWVDENCSRCGLCVKICPEQNITLEEDGIHFADHCTLCLRCIHQCPQKAIQLGGFTKGKFRWHGPKGEFKPLKILNK